LVYLPGVSAALKVDIDFRLKIVSFENKILIVTMKKNEHYFPTVEWIKDPSESCGWRRVTYKGGKAIKDKGHDGIQYIVGESFETDGGGN
jgi:hypothetical protein